MCIKGSSTRSQHRKLIQTLSPLLSCLHFDCTVVCLPLRTHTVGGKGGIRVCVLNLVAMFFSVTVFFFGGGGGSRSSLEYSRQFLETWATPACDTVDPRNMGDLVWTQSSHA